ncbi:hypothetical protein D9M71_782510 [compost metagenome]
MRGIGHRSQWLAERVRHGNPSASDGHATQGRGKGHARPRLEVIALFDTAQGIGREKPNRLQRDHLHPGRGVDADVSLKGMAEGVDRGQRS